jgi:hypothetical protein
MKKLITLFFSVVIMIGASSMKLSAQSDKKPTVAKEEKAIIPTPIPKKTHVQYAPGHEPTLAEQIKTDDTFLKKLKTIPAQKRSKYTQERITRLEKGLVEKRKKQANTSKK